MGCKSLSVNDSIHNEARYTLRAILHCFWKILKRFVELINIRTLSLHLQQCFKRHWGLMMLQTNRV